MNITVLYLLLVPVAFRKQNLVLVAYLSWQDQSAALASRGRC